MNKLKAKGRCSPKVDGITFRLCSSRCEKVRDWGVDRATAGCKFVSSTRPSPPTEKPTKSPTEALCNDKYSNCGVVGSSYDACQGVFADGEKISEGCCSSCSGHQAPAPTPPPTCISGEYPPTSVGTRGCYPREQCTESYASKYCANLLCIPQGMNGECSGAISRLNGWGASITLIALRSLSRCAVLVFIKLSISQHSSALTMPLVPLSLRLSVSLCFRMSISRAQVYHGLAM